MKIETVKPTKYPTLACAAELIYEDTSLVEQGLSKTEAVDIMMKTVLLNHADDVDFVEKRLSRLSDDELGDLCSSPYAGDSFCAEVREIISTMFDL